MLEAEIKQQLQTVFSDLKSEIDLVYSDSLHVDQKDLIPLLESLAETSSKIKVIKAESSEKSVSPQFSIWKNGQPTGITFKGIPTGHEFSSLVLAILNVDGKGKWPDQNFIKRIQSLKGAIRVRTYISLTCENCPDVVQTLNLMSLIHSDFKHEMIDGSYFQDEISDLGIQGVPSVVADGQLVHSGRISFLDLLKKMEDFFGAESVESAPVDLGRYDVAVIGGGPAGASAAIYSVRKGLKTIIIAEKFGGQVQETKGIENLISVVYTEGPQLSAELIKHISSYPIQLLEHRRVNKVDKNKNLIELDGGEFLTAESIIVTTGAKWRELGVPGEKEYLGRGVAFCPHCDGPYYKGKKIAVVGGGNSGVEAAIDLAGIVNELILFEYNENLKADQVLVDKLKNLPNVSVVTSAKTKAILGDGQKVNKLVYQDRKTEKDVEVDLDGIFVQIGLLPNSHFIKDVVETNKFGEIIVDEKGRTSAKGIYAAGDVTTTPYKQIVIAMGEGAKAALSAFEDRMYAKH